MTTMKKIALINDLSGFGKCSLTAAIPVISVMGIQACPLPTAVLTAQTGFPSYYCDDYTDKMDYFTKEWNKMNVSFDGIYSGYLASTLQIEKVQNFLNHFQQPDTIYLADPVMGDHGKAYPFFSKELLYGMQALTSCASILTPNLTELCLLAEADYEELQKHCHSEDYLKRIREICQILQTKAKRPQTILVTGILRSRDDAVTVTNLAHSPTDCIHIETPYTGVSFSGTGDLFASVICGSMVNGLSLTDALQKAADFLQPAIEEATRAGIPRNHGIHFEQYLSRLL